MPAQAEFARRTAFVTLLAVVWPAYIVMRVGAQWIFDKEDDSITGTPTWLAAGIAVGDGGVLVLIGLTVLGWLALRRRPSVGRYFAGLRRHLPRGARRRVVGDVGEARRVDPSNRILTAPGDFSHRRGIASPPVSAVAYDLRGTRGYLVADAHGRLVGRVECPMYGTTPDEPDALAVRTGFFARKRRLVPADAIEQIDGQSRVIGLRVDRDGLLSFL